MAWGCSHKVIFCDSPCGVVMDPAMAIKAHGEKIPNIVQLVANSSGLVMNL